MILILREVMLKTTAAKDAGDREALEEAMTAQIQHDLATTAGNNLIEFHRLLLAAATDAPVVTASMRPTGGATKARPA